MKKTLLKLLPLAIMYTGFAHAGELTFKKEKEYLSKYFDANEVITDFYIHQKDSDSVNEQSVFLFRVRGEAGSEASSTICVNAFEIDRVEKRFLSSKKTVYYNHQLVNATKIKAIRPLTTEEKLKLGFDADEEEDIGRVELSDGTAFYALTPSRSTYSVCGKGTGKNQVNSKSALAVEYYNVYTSSCFKREEPSYPRLGRARDNTSYFYGDDAKPVFERCQTQHAKLMKDIEEKAAEKAQARKAADERFEVEKKTHKMIPGVQILGQVGVTRAQYLVSRCFHFNRFTDKELTKEEWRNTKCGGYYREEIEDLLREMRVRGLIYN